MEISPLPAGSLFLAYFKKLFNLIKALTNVGITTELIKQR